ncbi:transporter substrate-binding domain-containing protein [Mesorhizobium sp. B2-4-19]|uniref:transporter substrate-binding domain-containing protein n=1 Tax=Mesorhizobium sp. B2-4-19 TaxID=2589930 RepID=UPI001FEDC493|nr:transporter substrate-binding domain-containing protein [Mesorhizobium sp. B2-4-19]
MQISKWILSGAGAAMLSMAAGSPSAQAAEKKSGTEGAYPPFNTITSDGKVVGFDIDIANALCAQVKIECFDIY